MQILCVVRSWRPLGVTFRKTPPARVSSSSALMKMDSLTELYQVLGDLVVRITLALGKASMSSLKTKMKHG